MIDTTCCIESLINKDATFTKETKKSSDQMKKAKRELIENHKRDKKRTLSKPKNLIIFWYFVKN